MSGEQYPTGFRRRCAVFTLMAATLMMSMDQTIANVALPHIQGSLSATQEQAAWILTSYIVCSAITMPILGWACLRWGRKRIFLLSVLGFTVTSAACGMAGNINQIVLFRALQGISGAALLPLSQAVMLDIHPPAEHKSAMNVWAIGVIFGPIMGPVLGAWITDSLEWRWIFYINLPVGILAFLGLMAFVSETKIGPRQPFDFFGFATLAVAIGCIQLLIDRGEFKDWFASNEIITEATVAGLAAYLFLVHSATGPKPFISPQIFFNRNFIVASMVGIMQVSTFVTVMTLQPTFFQELLGYPVLLAGVSMAPRGIGMMCGALISGRLHRFDVRHIVIVGFVLIAYGTWQMTVFSLGVDLWPIITTGLIQGLGTGLIFGSLTAVAFSTLPPHLRTEGATLYSLLRMFGTSLAIALAEARFTAQKQVLYNQLGQYVRPDNVLAQPPFVGPRFGFSGSGIANFDFEVNRQAEMLGYLDDFRLVALLAVFAIPFVMLLRRPTTSQNLVIAD